MERKLSDVPQVFIKEVKKKKGYDDGERTVCPQNETVCARLPLGMLTAGELLVEELVFFSGETKKKD